MLLEIVRAYCLKHTLFSPGPVVVAVSGGADSLTLLHILWSLREELRIIPHVATLDHRIRSESSAQDIAFVQKIADEWNIPFTAGSVDVPLKAEEWNMGIEEAARRARYTFLGETARSIDAMTIAAGHNQDDQAETVLMHAIRGSGLAGLRGILPKTLLPASSTIQLVRPLLEVPRFVIDAYIAELGIQPRHDETNNDTRYTRNRLRHDIMPLLAQLNPQVRGALARTADILREDYEALQSSLPPLGKRRIGLSIKRELFLKLPISQQRMLLREAAQRLSPRSEITFERTEAAIALVSTRTHGARLPLGGEVWLWLNNGLITILSKSEFDTYPQDCPSLLKGIRVPIKGTGIYPLPDGEWELHVERLTDPVFPASEPHSANLAITPGSRLSLRTRRNGDRFKPRGMNGRSQKLSDMLINWKVPSAWREHVPLLIVSGEIAWCIAPTEDGVRARIGENVALAAAESRPVWRFTYVRRTLETQPQ